MAKWFDRYSKYPTIVLLVDIGLALLYALYVSYDFRSLAQQPWVNTSDLFLTFAYAGLLVLPAPVILTLLRLEDKDLASDNRATVFGKPIRGGIASVVFVIYASVLLVVSAANTVFVFGISSTGTLGSFYDWLALRGAYAAYAAGILIGIFILFRILRRNTDSDEVN